MKEEELARLIILRAIEQNISSERELIDIERDINRKCHKYFVPFYKLLEVYKSLVKQKNISPNKTLESILKKARIRSLSGIVAITVITKPYPCPGNCLYCPNVDNMPKSYLPDEPACRRALLNNFDPYKQIQTRIQTLKANGHPTDKIELIILGGTWSYYPKQYQKWFTKRCFDGANNKTSPTLLASQKINESANNRIIGLTLETRPDYITPEGIKRMRILGATRIELGVQSLDNDILKFNNRGHNVEETIKATKLLKNAGFKITYHLMLNLPGSDIKKDEKMFETLFSNPDFQPDQLKIYPCSVLKEAPLYKLFLDKKYQPYTEEELIRLLIKIKEKVPPYVRIVRVSRDIPSNDIVAGNKVSNLRQIIFERMKKQNTSCQCLRCREPHDLPINFKNVKSRRREYDTNGGKEIFLSYEDIVNNKVLAFLRLRLPNEWSLPNLNKSALVRELHSYGIVAPLKQDDRSNVQHKGLGHKLMSECEKIVKKETNYNKIAVISGVGVRSYYRKLGYRLSSTYMIKKLE
ncbi:MAG: tRNA uridine(34) 5-carboxymethylaminomethyl modification radical SAM/GNAT enzyme Elp3 [Candidatus Pacebacteria bacterium]|nr:tRNA uridine(34) 5-carboxymethylaminomethyl modification radical SAM/GNAT enzyme Elp3 [Candidatus Paceibacterota bacterium]